MTTPAQTFLKIYADDPTFPMDWEKYQTAQQQFANIFDGREWQRPMIAALALSGESGEIGNLSKKQIGYEKDIALDKYEDEAGDLLWYVSELCRLYDVDLTRVMSEVKAAPQTLPKNMAKVQLMRAATLISRATDIQKIVFEWEQYEGQLDSRQGHTPPGLLSALRYFVEELGDFGHMIGMDLSRVATSNIGKLNRRFGGGGFDSEKALAKGDENDPDSPTYKGPKDNLKVEILETGKSFEEEPPTDGVSGLALDAVPLVLGRDDLVGPHKDVPFEEVEYAHFRNLEAIQEADCVEFKEGDKVKTIKGRDEVSAVLDGALGPDPLTEIRLVKYIDGALVMTKDLDKYQAKCFIATAEHMIGHLCQEFDIKPEPEPEVSPEPPVNKDPVNDGY